MSRTYLQIGELVELLNNDLSNIEYLSEKVDGLKIDSCEKRDII